MASPIRLLGAGLLSTILLFAADDPATVRKEIQTTYDRALESQRKAKTIEDLDAVSRQTDTPDWVSIVNDGPPRHWQDLREATAQSLGHFPEGAVRVVKLTLNGNAAVVIARGGSLEDVNQDRGVLLRHTSTK